MPQVVVCASGARARRAPGREPPPIFHGVRARAHRKTCTRSSQGASRGCSAASARPSAASATRALASGARRTGGGRGMERGAKSRAVCSVRGAQRGVARAWIAGMFFRARRKLIRWMFCEWQPPLIVSEVALRNRDGAARGIVRHGRRAAGRGRALAHRESVCAYLSMYRRASFAWCMLEVQWRIGRSTRCTCWGRRARETGSRSGYGGAPPSIVYNPSRHELVPTRRSPDACVARGRPPSSRPVPKRVPASPAFPQPSSSCLQASSSCFCLTTTAPPGLVGDHDDPVRSRSGAVYVYSRFPRREGCSARCLRRRAGSIETARAQRKRARDFGTGELLVPDELFTVDSPRAKRLQTAIAKHAGEPAIPALRRERILDDVALDEVVNTEFGPRTRPDHRTPPRSHAVAVAVVQLGGKARAGAEPTARAVGGSHNRASARTRGRGKRPSRRHAAFWGQRPASAPLKFA